MTAEEKFNLENAADTPIVKNLRALLNALIVKDLRGIGDLFVINRLSNKPKKELVNIIYNVLTDENKLSEVIERFIDKEFNLLKELMDNKGTIQDNEISVEAYNFLYMIGIVFIFKRNDKFYVSMTDDVYNALKKVQLNKFDSIIKENTRMYNLVRSMVELYGVVSYDELENYYNLYYGNVEDIDMPRNVLFFCDRYDNINIIHTQDNMYFVNRMLNNDSFEVILDEIVCRQEQIKRKPIELYELLKYVDYDYYEETDSKNKFKKYLRKQGVSEEVVENIIRIISQMYRLGSSFIGVSFEMLQDYGVEVNQRNMQVILNYLIPIYNNTRVWSNNGWTPIEMRESYK